MNEAAARLPCALSGLLAVALVMLLAKRLYGTRTGLFSGAILATSYSFVFFSRHASADVETLTGELAALLLFKRNEDHPDGWWVVGLWLIMAVTSLMKGLLGFALPLLTIGSYALLCNGWSELFAHLRSGPLTARVRGWSTGIVGFSIGSRYWRSRWGDDLTRPSCYAGVRAPGAEKGCTWYGAKMSCGFQPFGPSRPNLSLSVRDFALMAPWAILSRRWWKSISAAGWERAGTQ